MLSFSLQNYLDLINGLVYNKYMGYNTNVTILNDAFDQIEKYPDQFVAGIRHHMNGNPLSINGSFRVGNHMNAAQVLRTEHADVTQLIAVGMNSATKVLSEYYLPPHDTEKGQVEILRAWANKLGYNLTKQHQKQTL